MKILHVLPYIPVPAIFGGALRINYLLKSLASEHEVTVVTFGDPKKLALFRKEFEGLVDDIHLVPDPWSKTWKRVGQGYSLISSRSFSSLSYHSRKMQQKIDELLSSRHFDAVQTEFPYMSQFDFGDERTLFDIPTDPNCCHTGGAVRFGPDGYLYVAVGDNSNPHELDGFAPLSTDDLARDARRTSGNTQDLRGKILRIAPSADGSYEVPAGNLFADAEQGRLEIYVMGARNPYTYGFDAADGALYFGDVGPDARTYTDEGPRGYDEINRVTEAGNFGWPFFIGDNGP
jgi:hypothetical protein